MRNRLPNGWRHLDRSAQNHVISTAPIKHWSAPSIALSRDGRLAGNAVYGEFLGHSLHEPRPSSPTSTPAPNATLANPIPMQPEPYNRTMPFASVKKIADADFPTRWGHFRILGFEGIIDQSATLQRNHPRPRHPHRIRRSPGHGRHPRRTPHRPHPLPVPHRRRLPLAPLRLPPAARTRARHHRRRRHRHPPLRAAGGPRHRPHGQTPRLRASGPGPRHRRSQPRTRLRRRLPRLRAPRRDPQVSSASKPSASSPTIPEKVEALDSPASKSPSASPPKFPANPPTSATSRPSTKRWATWSAKFTVPAPARKIQP